jgi:hypothetical protein
MIGCAVACSRASPRVCSLPGYSRRKDARRGRIRNSAADPDYRAGAGEDGPTSLRHVVATTPVGPRGPGVTQSQDQYEVAIVDSKEMRWLN